jgi:1,2-phenylacetyl-CoA epoxidase PaaB subunit
MDSFSEGGRQIRQLLEEQKRLLMSGTRRWEVVLSNRDQGFREEAVTVIAEDIEEAIVEARKTHPRRGGWLVERVTGV